MRDGDTGRPRPVELSLAGDTLGYFTLVQTSLTADGILTAALTTTDNVIDRENPNILKEGGLYQFEVRTKINSALLIHFYIVLLFRSLLVRS